MNIPNSIAEAHLKDISGCPHTVLVDSSWVIQHDGVAIPGYRNQIGVVAAGILTQVDTIHTIDDIKAKILDSYVSSRGLGATAIPNIDYNISRNYSKLARILVASKFAPLKHNLLQVGSGKYSRVVFQSDLNDEELAEHLVQENVKETVVSNRQNGVAQILLAGIQTRREILNLSIARREATEVTRTAWQTIRTKRTDEESEVPQIVKEQPARNTDDLARLVGNSILQQAHGAVFDVASLSRELGIAGRDTKKVAIMLNVLMRGGYLQIKTGANNIIHYVRTGLGTSNSSHG